MPALTAAGGAAPPRPDARTAWASGDRRQMVPTVPRDTPSFPAMAASRWW
jgi:hypothetical protein